MAKQLLIQLNRGQKQADASVRWILLENQQVSGAVNQGTLAEVAAAAAVDTSVTVIVPAEDIFLSHQHLPGKNRQRLLKAVPFALEDQIIDDVEDMHFALGAADKQNHYWIAAVAHEQMMAWQKLFASVGLNPQALVPDVMLLTSAADELHLLCQPERTLLALPDQSRLVIDNTNLALILKSISLNPEFSFHKLECFTEDRSLDLDAMVAAHVNCDVNAHVTEPLLLFAKSLTGHLPINLLQGSYSRREQRRHRFQAWYPAAAMLAVWIVARLLIAGIDNFQLSRQLDAIHAQQQKLYQQAFPTAKPGGDVFRKMQSAVRRLKEKHGTMEAGFYHMLARLAPMLGESSGLQLQSLRYRQGRIELELYLPSLQSLDQLKTALASQPQWQVEIQSASSAKNHVEARLQIRSQT